MLLAPALFVQDSRDCSKGPLIASTVESNWVGGRVKGSWLTPKTAQESLQHGTERLLQPLDHWAKSARTRMHQRIRNTRTMFSANHSPTLKIKGQGKGLAGCPLGLFKPPVSVNLLE